MNRTQLYLGGLLLVQVVLILVLRSPFSGTSAGFESRTLLPALDAITPSRLEIRGDEDESIELVRHDGAWQVAALGGFPADGEKVEQLVDNLKALRVRRPVVSSGRYHDSFKVADDDHEARIRLWDEPDGEPEIDLILGSSPNFRTAHVRVAGEDEVYEVRGLSSYDVQPEPTTWIEKELVSADELAVTGLTLTNEAGTFELAKQDGTWTVVSPDGDAGIALDQEKVDGLVRTVSSIRLSDGTGPVDETTHGFASPSATLVLRWEEAGAEEGTASRQVTVKVGGQVPDNESQRYVTRDGFGFTGTIWESSVRRLLEEKLDDLTTA